MKRRKRWSVCKRRSVCTAAALIALASLACASPAAAQVPDIEPIEETSEPVETGWYLVGLGALQHRERAEDVSATSIEFESGASGSGVVGYRFGWLGFEGEFSYLRNAASALFTPPGGSTPAVGHASLRAVLGTIRFTFTDGVFRPYLAAGFGGLKASFDGISMADGPQPRIDLNGSNEGVVFAYHLRAGAGIRLARRVEVLVGYRYLRSGELLFIGTAFGDLRPTGARTHHLETGLKIAL